jgi:hypothetical protein
MNRFLPLVLLAVAGCADPLQWTTQWSRPSTPGQTLQADLADCRSEASQGTERARRIDDDTTRMRDHTNDNYGGALVGDLRRFDTDKVFYDTIDRCMRGRGYAPAGFAR